LFEECSHGAEDAFALSVSGNGGFYFKLAIPLFNAFLGRQLSLEYFGLVTFVNTIWSFVTIFTSTYGTTVNHETAYASPAVGKRDGAWLLALLRRGSISMSVVSLVWVMFVPWLSSYFRVDVLILYLFTPVFVFGILGSAMRGFIQGKLRFYTVAIAILFEPLAKFILAAGFVFSGRSDLSYLSIPFSIVLASIFVFAYVIRDIRMVYGERLPSIVFPKQFYAVALVGSIGTLLFLNVDVLLVKHYFSPVIAGEYALLALVGKMIFFIGTLPLSLLITLVSRVEGEGRNPRKTFYMVYTLTGIFVAGSVFVFWMFGDVLVPLLLGERALTILPYLLVYTAALGFFTPTNVIATYHLAREHFFFPFILLFAAISMAIFVFLNHATLHEVSESIFWVSFLSWVVIQVLDIAKEYLPYVHNGIRDFLGIFERLPLANARKDGRYRVLIFNWRDKRHKYAGGAEEYVHEIAKKWAAEGHQILLFCGNDGQSPRYETIDGVKIIRRGGFYLVYVWAFIYYFFRLRNQCDIIIDCQNGVPFFTPLYARKPIYCLMHHVHQSVFFRDLIKPLAHFASFLERGLMPVVYRNTRFITVSESSQQEMIGIGLGRSGIDIVHPGVHFEELGRTEGEKSTHPTILYLGRLKAYKSVDVLIRAFALVLRSAPDAELIIAGSGEEQKNLQYLVSMLGVDNRVKFMGYVSESEKYSLFRSAWVVVNPSYMEGWGIVSIEANACGTPVIASNVPGLRDSVRDTCTGYLVEYGNIEKFAEKILLVLQNKELRVGLETGAQAWAGNFDWNKSSAAFLTFISERRD
ncbi:MAG: glycosyltransferase, partial [Candidatus Moraniibacteriota bacterium]